VKVTDICSNLTLSCLLYVFELLAALQPAAASIEWCQRFGKSSSGFRESTRQRARLGLSNDTSVIHDGDQDDHGGFYELI